MPWRFAHIHKLKDLAIVVLGRRYATVKVNFHADSDHAPQFAARVGTADRFVDAAKFGAS